MKNYREIKTVEDALKATGRPSVPEFSELPEDLRTYFQAQYKAVVIAEALNGKWKANWADGNQKKWFPYFGNFSSLMFCDTGYSYSTLHAGNSSYLCFKSKELAEIAGRKFMDIYKQFIFG